MNDAVRLGFVGLGRWGGYLADAVVRSGAGVIVRCFTRTASTRAQFAARFSCRPAGSLAELLADPDVDAVVVATPHSTHAGIASAAATAGKHVFIEKPLALTVADGERVINAATDAGVVLHVANHRRHQAGIRRIKSWVDAGELGTLQLIEANFSTNISVSPQHGWKEDLAERPLGGMTSLGLHILDDFTHIAGPVSQVAAFSRPVLGRGNLDDATVFTLEFQNGTLGYFGTGMAVPKMELLAVHGSSGSAWNEAVIAPGAADLQADRLYRQDIAELERTMVPNEPVDTLAEQMLDFARCVRSGRCLDSSAANALYLVTLLSAGIESQRTRAAVPV